MVYMFDTRKQAFLHHFWQINHYREFRNITADVASNAHLWNTHNSHKSRSIAARQTSVHLNLSSAKRAAKILKILPKEWMLEVQLDVSHLLHELDNSLQQIRFLILHIALAGYRRRRVLDAKEFDLQ